MKKLVWLIAALSVEIGSIFVSRILRLPDFAAAAFTTAPAFLLLYPFLTPLMPRTKFRHWAIATVVCSTFVGAAFFLLGRLGWN